MIDFAVVPERTRLHVLADEGRGGGTSRAARATAGSRLITIAVIVAASASACSNGHRSAATRRSTPVRVDESPLRQRPLPTLVTVRHRPELGTLADPAFVALPGARAEYGRLGGSTYQIEIPTHWNGRLVLWMHGFAEFASELKTGPPKFRRYLVAHGFAWGASSFSSVSLIPGRAADETAALWDHFVAKHGRPTWTYVSGFSMGGWATNIAAERYGNRFDGALALCGAVGTIPALRIDADFFVAGAFVAGVTQAEYDTTGPGELIDTKILPALAKPAARARFEDIMIDLTGGPRAFDHEGLDLEWDTKWQRARELVAAQLAPQRDNPYHLGPTSRVTSAEFNAKAIRPKTNHAAFRTFSQGMEVTGKLAMPLLTMHTTGDEQVPIDQAQILRARVHAAGRDALLIQRVVKDPGHCGFSAPEQEAAFAALVQWVEHGKRPAGTNLDITDLRKIAPTFELAARPETAAMPGAQGRASLHGSARLNGARFDARFVGAVVLDHGLVTPCNVTIPSIVAGHFELNVFGENELAGCGRRGSKIILWTYAGDKKLYSTTALDWPTTHAVTVMVDFSTTDPAGAAARVLELSGEVYRADNQRVPAGARVEAYIGDTLCGIATVRVGVFDGYIMDVVGPDSIPGCRAGATITFRVNGTPAVETTRNGGTPPRQFDLTLR
jgi:pimeloyl-ACP methyl ester carboxylesterase